MKIDEITSFKLLVMVCRVIFLGNFIVLTALTFTEIHIHFEPNMTLKKLFLEVRLHLLFYGLATGVVCIIAYITLDYLKKKIKIFEEEKFKRYINP